jgi:hypothetical protein
MQPSDVIYLVPDHPSDFGRYTTPEYHALATFLREEVLTHTSYEALKEALAHALGTSVEMWAMGGMTYIGVAMMQGTASSPFVVPEWRRVYRLVTLPEGTTDLPKAAELIAHWQALPPDLREPERQELTGERPAGDD